MLSGLLATTGGTLAQSVKFPIYDNQRVARPNDVGQSAPDDFTIDLARLNRYPEGFVYGDQSSLTRLGHHLLSDQEGIELWTKEAENASRIVNQWDLHRTGFAANRYIYSIVQLENLSLVYLFSGHRDLGRFIRAHVLQIADLPLDFWLHAELRGYDARHPLGMIETAAVTSAVSVALSASDTLFSPSERKHVETALRSKGLQPCLNWLEAPKLSNFTAVISSGAFTAARYFKDSLAKEKARQALIGYIDGSIEEDGSYGEGTGYFNYPIGAILSAALCMNRQERKQTFSSSGLRHSATWQVYPYLFNTNRQNDPEPTVLHYGDNSWYAPPSVAVNQLLATVYQDSVAAWLIDKFKGKRTFREALLAFSDGSGVVGPKSPDGLPLQKVFDSGDCYIRSGWADNGIVLAMRSGDGSRVKFNHQRAELHSITMGAYGEYLIVSPGSASYRSPLHYLYDYTTRAANTITMDGKNQRFPSSGLNQWSREIDNSAFWVNATPKAEVIVNTEGKAGNLIVSEAAEAYEPDMKRARRSVLFVKDPGYFVVVDELEASGNTKHQFSYRLHFNNRDGKATLKSNGETHWLLERPLSDLDISIFSETPMTPAIGDGYMHGPTRDYSPGGENEGKPGSAIELTVSNAGDINRMVFYTVLFPVRKGEHAPSISHRQNTISVGSDQIIWEGNAIKLTKEGTIEAFEIP